MTHEILTSKEVGEEGEREESYRGRTGSRQAGECNHPAQTKESQPEWRTRGAWGGEGEKEGGTGRTVICPCCGLSDRPVNLERLGFQQPRQDKSQSFCLLAVSPQLNSRLFYWTVLESRPLRLAWS